MVRIPFRNWRVPRCVAARGPRFLRAVPLIAGLLGVVTCGGDKTPTAPVMVLTTITVSLSTTTIQVGQTAGTMARGTDQNGGPIAMGPVAWSSSSPAVATISAIGSITAVAPGQTSIIASLGSATGQAMLTVVPVPVASVTVSPASAQIVLGATQQLSAVPLDAGNVPLTGRTVSWSSSDSSKARVSGTGLVTAVALGSATISATIEGRIGTAAITVVTSLLGDFGLELFVLIPAGSFQMGSTVGVSSEGPIHSVTISRAFYLQKTELTQGQWRTVMGANPSAWQGCGDSCPVELVSWNEVQAFLLALNGRTPGVTYRLPSEAEWEYAARAGSTDNALGALDGIAWYSGNSGLRSHPVALKAPNAWGLYDMLGNVYEFVADWYGAYTSDSVTDPTGPATGTLRVLRGGSYRDSTSLRAAYRGGPDPAGRGANVGFRLVRSP